MDSFTLSQQLLEPIQKSRLYSGCLYDQYRLLAMPPSLASFSALLETDYSDDRKRVIWLTDGDAFISENPVEDLLATFCVTINLWGGTKVSYCTYCIQSFEEEHLITGLHLIFGLPDPDFDRIYVYNDPLDSRTAFPPSVLKNLMSQNKDRDVYFTDMIFSGNQIRALAAAGTRNHIEFDNCYIEDEEGTSFAGGSDGGKHDNYCSLADMTLRHSFPVEEDCLESFFKTFHIKNLTLDSISVKTLKGCQAVLNTGMEYLNITKCKFEDGGAALIDCMLSEQCPKTLVIRNFGHSLDFVWGDFLEALDCEPFDSHEKLASFFYALCHNTRLERLDVYLPSFFSMKGPAEAFASAIAQNDFLQWLGVGSTGGWEEGDHCWEVWKALIKAFVSQKSIQTLDLSSVYTPIKDNSRLIMDVSDMLKENMQINRILLDKHSDLDCGLWHELVIPKLECNKYRKLIASIQRIKTLSTRAAVMAEALGGVASRPSITCILLSQNCDVIANYLLTE